jgi:uncharacterized integral membrane protein
MFIVLVLIIIILIAAFALQNATPVAVAFLLWKFEASVAVLIFLCALAGVIVGIILAVILKSKLSSRTTL